jgi:hypothetical protein
VSQSHGSSLWQEPAGSGGAPAIAPAYLVRSGGAFAVIGPDGQTVGTSLTGPEALAYGVAKLNGEYALLDVAPVYVVASGADLVIAAAGPADAIFAAAGGGDVELTTDLSRAPIADLYYDEPHDTLWLIRRPLVRLGAVYVRGAVHLY